MRTDIRSAPLLAAWGLAWLLGYGALRLGRRPDFTVPAPHMAFFIATLVCAGLYTAVYISRRIRGIRGGSVDQGARLGAAWCGARSRSEERRVGKECRSRWSPYH